MRIAVLSDIHGNGIALDAVLADLQHEPTDQIVCMFRQVPFDVEAVIDVYRNSGRLFAEDAAAEYEG